MRKKRKNRWTQYVLGVLLIVLAMVIAAGIWLYRAVSPYYQARELAIQTAKKTAHLKHVSAFNIVNLDEPVYSIQGEDQAGQTVYVLIPQKTSTIQVVGSQSGADISDKLSGDGSRLKSIRVGLLKGEVVYTVRTDKHFSIYDFKTGEEKSNETLATR